ncbi:MAG: imidazolonepropionase [Acidobacteria bacterium]|nr:MAG: imidazolonepropionase [Acidobacteriota bacterium]
MYSIIYNASNLVTLENDNLKEGPRKGSAMAELGEIPGGAVVYSAGKIVETGTSEALLKKYPDPIDLIDAGGRLVMPGFVDCHTHLVYAGNRSSEMLQRLQGATYLDILKAGGGINKTVRATREASSDDLKRLGMNRLDHMLKHGTTTVEIKSGYGLDEMTEHKILDVIGELKSSHVIDMVATYLGAHTVPKDRDRCEYITWLKGASLSAFQKKAEFFDIFCEDGAFSKEESIQLLEAAQSAGFRLKAHAGQFNDLGLTGVAAKMGAVSVDHLDHIDDHQIDLMAETDCVGVFLPGVPFFLKTGVFPDMKRFRDRAAAFAIASDFNPGSCPSFSMPMMVSLAVLHCNATLPEAICASTLNAAYAMGVGNETGSLKAGKKADFIVLDIQTLDELPYYFGTCLTHCVLKNGEVVFQSEI